MQIAAGFCFDLIPLKSIPQTERDMLSDVERRSLSSLSDRILYKMKNTLLLTSERQGICFIKAD